MYYRKKIKKVPKRAVSGRSNCFLNFETAAFLLDTLSTNITELVDAGHSTNLVNLKLQPEM
jgi:hypothetical protein